MAECVTVTQSQLDLMRSSAPGASLRPGGEESFRVPWELRSLAVGVATFERGAFEWPEFQGALTDAIGEAETGGQSEHYYARWVEAYEALVLDRVGIDVSEVDERTKEVLATPRDATHQHAHREPVASAHGHNHDHGHDHGHGH